MSTLVFFTACNAVRKVNGEAFAGGDNLLDRAAYLIAFAHALNQARAALFQIDAEVGIEDFNPAACTLEKAVHDEFCDAMVYLSLTDRIYVIGLLRQMAAEAIAQRHLNTNYFQISDELKTDPSSGRELNAYAPLEWNKTFYVIYSETADRDFVAGGGLVKTMGHELGHPHTIEGSPDKDSVKRQEADADDARIGPNLTKSKPILDALGRLLWAYVKKYVKLSDAVSWTTLSGRAPGIVAVLDGAKQPIYFTTAGNTPMVGRLVNGSIKWKQMHGALKSVPAVFVAKNGDMALFARDLNDELVMSHYKAILGSWGPWVSQGARKYASGFAVSPLDEHRFAVVGARAEGSKETRVTFAKIGSPGVEQLLDMVMSGEATGGRGTHTGRFLYGGGGGHAQIYPGGPMAGVKNPVTNDYTCPEGYQAIQYSTYGPYDWLAWGCFKEYVDGDRPLAYLGGFVGTTDGGNWGNAAMNRPGCPEGFQTQTILAQDGFDYGFAVCWTPASDEKSEVFALRGLRYWSSQGDINGLYLTLSDGLPLSSPFVQGAQVRGIANVDNPLFTFGGAAFWNSFLVPSQSSSGAAQLQWQSTSTQASTWYNGPDVQRPSNESPALAYSEKVLGYLVTVDGAGKMYFSSNNLSTGAFSTLTEVSLGFSAASQPSAYVTANGTLFVVIRAADNAIHQGAYAAGAWTWTKIGPGFPAPNL